MPCDITYRRLSLLIPVPYLYENFACLCCRFFTCISLLMPYCLLLLETLNKKILKQIKKTHGCHCSCKRVKHLKKRKSLIPLKQSLLPSSQGNRITLMPPPQQNIPSVTSPVPWITPSYEHQVQGESPSKIAVYKPALREFIMLPCP